MTTLLTMKGFNKQIPADALYFEAWAANSAVKLIKNWNPTSVEIETSTDGINWSDYTFWTDIALSNVWDKLYMRNKSEAATSFSTWQSDYYYFRVTWSVAAYWSINYLLCKNSTDTLTWTYTFACLFYGTTGLTLPPSLPATTLTNYCYLRMFKQCSNLVWIPRLPALAMASNCYNQMFYQCTRIEISSTQTWSYTQEYRIPTIWAGTTVSWWNSYMFSGTWWTFTWAPTINTTYYTSNTLV